MKKILFLILILTLSTPLKSYAIQGACSYHNGVNCGYGPTITGKVMCNDGWENSKVLYSETEECKNSCPKYLPEDEYNYAMQQLSLYESRLTQLENEAIQSYNQSHSVNMLNSKI